MQDLGGLQALVWKKIKEAIGNGDSTSLRSLGQIADEMDRKHEEWRRLLDRGADSSDDAEIKISRNDPSSDGQGANALVEEDFSGRSIRAFELAGQKVPMAVIRIYCSESFRCCRNKT